ncbi:MAG TPA: prephenate dehydratase [Phycisphaerae bacterium]|nr:prephenate dehydratase [Phycisphaerae bacterium]
MTDVSNRPEDLSVLRAKIDALDKDIVRLLNDRARVVVDVGRTKQTDGTPIYAPDREYAVLSKIAELSTGPLPEKTLQTIYRELMSGSFALERPLRIGYLGPNGSFSHMASMLKFGASVEHQPLPDIRGVFEEVTRGHCDLGIVPIENSLGGGIIDTMDSFIDANVNIFGEVLIEIHHNLLANTPPDKIKIVASKPEIFAQCRKWLSTGIGNVELVPVASSSKAAELASAETGLAAIGSSLAAELYNLKIVFANIEDNPDNTTRFFILSKDRAKPSGNDKTTLMFTTANRSGALVEMLNIMARYEVNLTNIDTRPSKRRNWEYYFFIDADGHCEDQNFIDALEEARTHCGELHVLGSYPRPAKAL